MRLSSGRVTMNPVWRRPMWAVVYFTQTYSHVFDTKVTKLVPSTFLSFEPVEKLTVAFELPASCLSTVFVRLIDIIFSNR